MPMHRCIATEHIFDNHLDLIAAAKPNDGSENRSRVPIGRCRLCIEEGMSSGCGLELDGISFFRRIDEFRDRQGRMEIQRVRFSGLTAAQNASAKDRGGANGKLAPGQHQKAPAGAVSNSLESEIAPWSLRWTCFLRRTGSRFARKRSRIGPERKTRWLGAERCLAAQLSHGAGKAVLMQPKLSRKEIRFSTSVADHTVIQAV